jgi:hypothetical protein
LHLSKCCLIYRGRKKAGRKQEESRKKAGRKQEKEEIEKR